jgi:hypothetical protein
VSHVDDAAIDAESNLHVNLLSEAMSLGESADGNKGGLEPPSPVDVRETAAVARDHHWNSSRLESGFA